jgi:hypothetical protein
MKKSKEHTNSEIVRLDNQLVLVKILFVLPLFRLAEMWTETMKKISECLDEKETLTKNSRFL